MTQSMTILMRKFGVHDIFLQPIYNASNTICYTFIFYWQRWPWEWDRVWIPIPVPNIPGNFRNGNDNFHRTNIPNIFGNIGNANQNFHRAFIPPIPRNFWNGDGFLWEFPNSQEIPEDFLFQQNVKIIGKLKKWEFYRISNIPTGMIGNGNGPFLEILQFSQIFGHLCLLIHLKDISSIPRPFKHVAGFLQVLVSIFAFFVPPGSPSSSGSNLGGMSEVS